MNGAVLTRARVYVLLCFTTNPRIRHAGVAMFYENHLNRQSSRVVRCAFERTTNEFEDWSELNFLLLQLRAIMMNLAQALWLRHGGGQLLFKT